VVSCGLALGLDQDRAVESILAVPRVEGREDLETVRARRNLDADSRSILGGCLVSILAGVVASSGQAVARRRSEQELVAVLVLELVGQGVEVQGAGDRQGDDEIRRGNERMRGGIPIVAPGEIPNFL
jgi:hypothetical protein